MREGVVLVVGGPSTWPADLVAEIARRDKTVIAIDDVRLVPFFVLAGGVETVLVDVRALEVLGALALRACRAHAPRTAIVAVATGSSAFHRALDCGATTVLEGNTCPEVMADVVCGGAAAALARSLR